MIVNTVLTAVAVVLGYLTLGLPGALAAVVVIGLVVAYDAHKRHVEQAEIDPDRQPVRSAHQHFGD